MKITIALPYLSRQRDSFFREGIGKFLGLLVEGIFQDDSEIQIEVWSYFRGIDSIQTLFNEHFCDRNCRITIINDFDEYKKSRHYKHQLKRGEDDKKIQDDFENMLAHKIGIFSKVRSRCLKFIQRYYLIRAIRKRSKADFVYYNNPIFFPLLCIIKPTIVQIHDLFTMQYEKEFINNNKYYFLANRKVSCWLGIQGLQGAHFVCSSYNTLNKQVLKYIPFIKKNRTHVVRFPSMVKDYGGKTSLTKKEFCSKYGITQAYIAYPTQNRPNKNIITLLRALDYLNDHNIGIQLVITGKFNEVKECEQYIKNHESVARMLVETGNLSEEELYMLYKYSDMVVSTSFVEGGCISGQVLEALKIGNVPVICALLDGIDEWLKVHNMDRSSADMNWFDRYDYIGLAERIKDVLNNQEKHINKQRHIFNDLNEQTWDVTGKEYLGIIKNMIDVNRKDKGGKAK